MDIYITAKNSLNDVQMSIAPPQPATLIINGQRVGPAQLVGDEGGGDVLAVQTHAADVGVAAPVTPVQESDNHATTGYRQPQATDIHRLQATTVYRQSQATGNHRLQATTGYRQLRATENHSLQTITGYRQPQATDNQRLQTTGHQEPMLKCQQKELTVLDKCHT